MALKYGKFTYREEDLGEDTLRVIPRFPEPKVLAFRAGEPVGPLAQSVVKFSHVSIDASPGAGKSTDFPIGLVSGGIKLVVHVVPTLQLQGALFKRVSGQHLGKNVQAVLEFDPAVEFPKTGLVITDGLTLILYMAYWNAKGLVSEYVLALYVDEVHSSDASTYTLRTLKTAAPAVGQYLQATATPGSGDAASPYRPLVTKGVLRTFTYDLADPVKWDMSQTNVPWSMKSLKGDFIVFVDDEAVAEVVFAKFTSEGILCMRFTSATPRDEFVRTKEAVEQAHQSGGAIHAFILDSSYGDGHTFTSVTRIIDTGLVKQVRPGPQGMPLVSYRAMYAGESLQRRCRAARTEGSMCDYWSTGAEPKQVAITLDGYEADSACILLRMLGYKPPKFLSGVPTFSGQVPKRLMTIMAGREPVRRYYVEGKCVPWPGGPHPIPEVLYESPVTVPSSPTVSVTGGSVDGDDFQHVRVERVPDADDVSVLSGSGSAESARTEFVNRHEADYGGGVERVEVGDAFGRACDKVLNKHSTADGGVRCGLYYYVSGIQSVTASALYPGGFDQLWRTLDGIAPSEYAYGLSSFEKPSVQRLLLDAYNGAVALESAALQVLDKAGPHIEKGSIDRDTVNTWVDMVRDAWVRAGVRKKSSFDYLRACVPVRNLKPVGKMVTLENGMITKLLDRLVSVASVGPDDPGVYQESLVQHSVAPWPDISGSYRVEWNSTNFRERVAMKLLGKPPTASVLFEAPVGISGTQGW